VPAELPRAPLPRTLIASGLLNPRGMHLLPSGELLVAEAGTGDPDNPNTGRLTRLRDANGDGDYLDEGERSVLLGGQPSKNILKIVRRDEVFGMAGIAEGGGQVMVARSFFGGPSNLFVVAGDQVTPWGETHLNINDLAYDPTQKAWVGVASTTDEVVRLVQGGGVERMVKIRPLPSGQDAVPGYLRHDPVTGKVLVSLFTGSPEGEEGGEGTELVPRAGGIIAVDPVARDYEWVVTGLTVPTDLEIAPDGSIYVLEFCDAFLDPVGTREAMAAGPSHGGFRRYSGRLLRVDRNSGAVTVVAEGLDAPSNLTISGDALYVAEGMGTPGRQIPTPQGVRPLVGFIERIELPR
jgi:glucose/arabinose dehydrogenase